MDRCRFIAAELVAALVVDNGSCMVKAGSLGLCSSCCVPFGRRLASDVGHHGRYGPEGQLCCEVPRSLPTSAVAYMAGFAGDDIFAVFLSVVVGRPMAVVDQKESLLAVACARLVLLVFSLRTLCFCCRSQALMPCIMAGMDQLFLDMVVHTPLCATTYAYGSDCI